MIYTHNKGLCNQSIHLHYEPLGSLHYKLPDWTPVPDLSVGKAATRLDALLGLSRACILAFFPVYGACILLFYWYKSIFFCSFPVNVAIVWEESNLDVWLASLATYESSVESVWVLSTTCECIEYHMESSVESVGVSMCDVSYWLATSLIHDLLVVFHIHPVTLTDHGQTSS